MTDVLQKPCREWEEQLIALHPGHLSVNEEIAFKQHLRTCQACSAAHNAYLAVGTQIRSLPLMKPQRRLSAEMLCNEKVLRDTEPLRSGVFLLRPRHAILSTLMVAVHKTFMNVISVCKLVFQGMEGKPTVGALVAMGLLTILVIGGIIPSSDKDSAKPSVPQSPSSNITFSSNKVDVNVTTTDDVSWGGYNNINIINTGKETWTWFIVVNGPAQPSTVSLSNTNIVGAYTRVAVYDSWSASWLETTHGTLGSSGQDSVQLSTDVEILQGDLIAATQYEQHFAVNDWSLQMVSYSNSGSQVKTSLPIGIVGNTSNSAIPAPSPSPQKTPLPPVSHMEQQYTVTKAIDCELKGLGSLSFHPLKVYRWDIARKGKINWIKTVMSDSGGCSS